MKVDGSTRWALKMLMDHANGVIDRKLFFFRKEFP